MFLTDAAKAIDLTGQAAAGCGVAAIVEDVYAVGGTHRVSTFAIAL